MKQWSMIFLGMDVHMEGHTDMSSKIVNGENVWVKKVETQSLAILIKKTQFFPNLHET